MKKRIEAKTSLTAQMTCLMRALSYYEKDANYHSNDYIASLLLPALLRAFSKFFAAKKIVAALAPKGIYEYIIARTKYIDQLIRKNKNDMEQVFILGAGFDSRSIRFAGECRQTAFFELDSPATQNTKLKRLQSFKIQIPSNAVYIPINFDNETIGGKLSDLGVPKGRACLFLLEGLIMYLNEQSIDTTFKAINDYAGAGSLVVFDYVHSSVIKKENKYQDERKLSNMVSAFGERWSYGFGEGEVKPFLLKHGFHLADEADSLRLEKRLFRKNSLKHPINGTHSIITAGK